MDSIRITVLFLEELKPNIEGKFTVARTNVELLVEAPIILHELFTMIGIALNIGLDPFVADEVFGDENPVDHFGHNWQMFLKQAA